MAIIKEGPPVGGHLGSAKYREGRQIMGILCKGGHISAAVYNQRSTWQSIDWAEKKTRKGHNTKAVSSCFSICSLLSQMFIFSFPDQWVGLPTLAQDISTTFQTATLKPEKDILLAVSGPSKLAQTWEVRTDEILI